MPWTSGDATSHTEAADTPKKRRQWAAVANSALSRCMKGKQDTVENRKKCEASAIRQANAAVKEVAMEEQDLDQTETEPVEKETTEKDFFLSPTPQATSFAELAQAREAAKMADGLYERSREFSFLAENVMFSPEIEDKGAALAALADEFATIIKAEAKEDPEEKQVSFLGKVRQRIHDAITKEPETTERDALTNGFTVYKDTDTGDWRWVAIYSNKFRDEDNPPEILADAAHRDFVKAVEGGEWPHPELWLWHVDGTRCGMSDLVTYDDRGFAVASGTFDHGKEAIAEALAGDDDLLVSHGMPVSEIERDTDDETIITRFRTREISVLPAVAAANKLTGFVTLAKDGGKEMGLPQDKRQFLAEKMGEEAVDALEADIGDKATAAGELGLEHKEADADAETETTTERAEVEQETEEVVDAEPAEAEPQITKEEIATAVGEAINMALEPLVERMNALEARLEQKKEDDEVKETLDATPASSLRELVIRSVIGRDETRVDGRTALAKDKPLEVAPVETEHQIPVIGAILGGGDWRQTLGVAPQE